MFVCVYASVFVYINYKQNEQGKLYKTATSGQRPGKGEGLSLADTSA